MALKHRRLLYSSFIGLFIVLTPLVILYATGYRYNLKNKRVEKTGIIQVITIPKNADIFVNDKLIGQSPSRFIKLLPDKYQLSIQKIGYFPWQKTVEVKSSLTAFYKDIILFKNTTPKIAASGQINILSISPDRQKMIFSVVNKNTEQIKIINLKSDYESTALELNRQAYTALELLDWSPSQNRVLLKKIIDGFNQYFIINTTTLETREIFDITRLDFENLAWGDASDDNLYGLRNAVLYQINLTTDSVNSLISANISDFQAKGSDLLFITQVVNESFLNKLSLSEPGAEVKKIKLPSPSDFKLKKSNQNVLVLLDKSSSDLFIIKANAFETADVADSLILQDKAKDIIWPWPRNNQELLFYTDFEISVVDLATQQKNLITRFGDVIKQAIWYPGNNYIIYQVNNSIKAIEKIGPDSRNDIELAKVNNLSQLGVDFSGKNLYFKGNLDSQPAVFQLELQ